MDDRQKLSNSSSHTWPPLRLGLAAEISALASELDNTQWWDREQIETQQLSQFRKLLQFVTTHSPFYGSKFSASGATIEDFHCMAAFRDLPLLHRQEIQAADEKFFCTHIPADQGKVGETQTSGSTGEPVRIKKTGISELFVNAFSLRYHYWAGIPFSSKLTTIRANNKAYVEHSNWGPPFVFLFQTGAAQVMPITTPLDQQIELLRKFQPGVLLVYPNNLKGLLERWQHYGFDLPGLTHIRTMGETLTEDIKLAVHELSAAISVTDAYSSEECGAIALQCPETDGYHVMSESLIVEVLDQNGEPCAPGEIGKIVITDLQNLASPVIRYDIGDYARVGEPCLCGRGLMKLDQILGRQRNLLIKPNGDRHWPLVGFRHFRAIAPIRQYQMIQESLERISVHFVTDQPLSDEQKTALTHLIQQKLGYEFEMDIIDQREDLPRQPNGKFEEFISRVS